MAAREDRLGEDKKGTGKQKKKKKNLHLMLYLMRIVWEGKRELSQEYLILSGYVRKGEPTLIFQ